MNWLIYQWRYSAIALSLLVAMIMTLFQFLSGSFDPGNTPWYFRSERAFTGMVLLIILIPSYMAVSLIVSTRRSSQLARQVDEMHGTDLLQGVQNIPAKVIGIAAVAGVLYALVFNVPGHGLTILAAEPTERAMIIGQVTIWTLLACFLAMRWQIYSRFREASQQVSIDLFETSKLRPFAQVGLIDVLMIAGGLVVSTVQSLDLRFDPDNYSKAIVILIPAAILAVLYPMWGIHKELQRQKAAELDQLNARIAQASKQLEADDMMELELLLQRRERVSAAATWPVDMAILQRFLFYIIIPPLAWVGAALVEFVIDGFIRS